MRYNRERPQSGTNVSVMMSDQITQGAIGDIMGGATGATGFNPTVQVRLRKLALQSMIGPVSAQRPPLPVILRGHILCRAGRNEG